MKVIFETWKYGDTRFLAFANMNGGISICDEHGNNYGSWYTIPDFKKKYTESVGNSLSLGKCNLRLIPV